METYLSIDCDFFYGTADDLSLQPQKALVEDPKAFVEKIPRASSRPLLCLDHHELLNDWDDSRASFDLCIHFDAHSDLFTDFNRAWELPLGVRGSLVGIGDYMFHALRERVFKNLIWVCPRWLDPATEKAKLRQVLGATLAAHVEVISYSERDCYLGSPIGICLCLSPEWSPEKDLPSFSTLARQLGSTQHDCAAWQNQAARRYAALRSGTDPLGLRFTFPRELIDPET